MRRCASILLLTLAAAGTLGCGNTENTQVTKTKKKARVDWNEQDQKADDWWASENTKKRETRETRETQSEYVAEREEDRADADQDRPLSERRRRRRTAKYTADTQSTGEERDERSSSEPAKPRRRLTDDIAEDDE